MKYRPGQASRLTPHFEIEGTLYLDGGGLFHPTSEVEYTFPGLSGRPLVYKQAIVVHRDADPDEIQFARFEALLGDDDDDDDDDEYDWRRRW